MRRDASQAVTRLQFARLGSLSQATQPGSRAFVNIVTSDRSGAPMNAGARLTPSVVAGRLSRQACVIATTPARQHSLTKRPGYRRRARGRCSRVRRRRVPSPNPTPDRCVHRSERSRSRQQRRAERTRYAGLDAQARTYGVKRIRRLRFACVRKRQDDGLGSRADDDHSPAVWTSSGRRRCRQSEAAAHRRGVERRERRDSNPRPPA